MGHNLNIENGRASMMSVRLVPWHGLGTVLDNPPATAAEAMLAASLGWEVGLKPVYCMERGIFYEIPEKKAVVRLDKWGQPECVPFGLVGNDYQVLQNREAFDFFDPIIQTGAVTYETAGALGNGERVWVLGRVRGEPIRIKGSEVDKVERYLLLSTGHDGRTSVQIRFTPIRVVCQNTLMASLVGKNDLFKVHHVPGMRSSLIEAHAAVNGILEEYEKLGKIYGKFADNPLDGDGLASYLSAIFPNPKRKQGQKDRSYEDACRKVRQLRNEAARLFKEGQGNDKPPAKDSLWAAYNGVVELVDHYWSYSSPWQRLDSVWFGEGKRLKEIALAEAMKLIASAA